MQIKTDQEIRLIPIDKIRILNPRLRNQKKFQQIVDSIAKLGLKKPITVSHRREEPECTDYDLVCGQGRLEAFKVLGEKEIPAKVIDVSREDRLVMSLVENLARKIPNQVELLQNIQILKERGDTTEEIAQKTGLSPDYINGILRLLAQGEERLVQAVAKGQLPLSVALDIVKAKQADLQNLLMEAYENKQLKGKEVRCARRIIMQRETLGKTLYSGNYSKFKYKKLSNAKALVKAYKKESEKQRQMIKKAKSYEMQLVFIVEGLKELCKDENFVNLLRAEQLDIMPPYLTEQIQGEIHGEKNQARI